MGGLDQGNFSDCVRTSTFGLAFASRSTACSRSLPSRNETARGPAKRCGRSGRGSHPRPARPRRWRRWRGRSADRDRPRRQRSAPDADDGARPQAADRRRRRRRMAAKAEQARAGEASGRHGIRGAAGVRTENFPMGDRNGIRAHSPIPSDTRFDGQAHVDVGASAWAVLFRPSGTSLPWQDRGRAQGPPRHKRERSRYKVNAGLTAARKASCAFRSGRPPILMS